MNYTSYSLTELIRHDAFIAWVLTPDAESDLFWKGYLEHFPEKKKTFESARDYIFLLAEDTGRHRPTEAQSSKMWKVVEDSMYTEEESGPEVQSLYAQAWQWFRVAASVMLISGIGVVSFWYLNRQTEVADQKTKPPVESVVELDNVSNETTKPRMVILPDGSSVVLNPGSELSYNRIFSNKKREVTLHGKAFFEIVKDPKKPFLVYSRGIVTKVLGTSFSIDAREKSGEVKVEVKTGKVTVFPISRENATEKEVERAEKKGIILYPDQRIALSLKSGKVLKPVETMVREREVQEISAQLFVFDETPVSEVFRSLEEAYHVKISFNAEALKKCPLTATLVGQPFSKKLAVICHAIDATYEINGDQVKILGNGCK